MKRKLAIVLFNLGGPDSSRAIRPFLRNLFWDKNIITAPWPVRGALSVWISTLRAPKVKPLYDEMGGGSPILANTIAQGELLEKSLATDENIEAKCFPCMRYWHPMTKQVVAEIAAWGADEIVLLPLYPQFSTTTTGSSVEEWHKQAARQKLAVPTKTICCYPTNAGWIKALADIVRPIYDDVVKQSGSQKPRILFSAHGLPKKIVDDKNDPYPNQVQMTAAAVVEKMGLKTLDWLVSYQSKVGRLEWISPSTESEIHRAGAGKTPLVIVPIAFVSEHLETLVELDVEYAALAKKVGVPSYHRAPTVSSSPEFIAGLKGLVQTALAQNQTVCEQTNPCLK